MNTQHTLYVDFLKIKNDWYLDDWSIPKELFEKIVEILPFGSTILELGSGLSTDLLQKFYNMYSIEEDLEFIGKYNSKYIHAPIIDKWYDISILKNKLENINYDLLLVDGPKGFRYNLYNNLNLFNINIPIIFDDTMAQEHFNLAYDVSIKTNKKMETIQCLPNPKAVYWFNGKKFSILI